MSGSIEGGSANAAVQRKGQGTSGAAQRIAVAYPRRLRATQHELASQHNLARRLAGILGLEFIEDYDPANGRNVHGIYYVPAQTLVDTVACDAIDRCLPDIRHQHDLFGGVVPHAFVATKAITHALLEHHSSAPTGWSREFSERVRGVVLNGITVFSIADAERASARLLHQGPVRVKAVNGTAGRGQHLVENRADLEIALEDQNLDEISQCGLVLEEHLDDVKTYSVGRVAVGELISTYVGVQSLTPDNSGATVYGGSELLFVRGDYDALLALGLPDAERRAIELSRLYDAAALECFRGLYASRRNYDVAQGKDSQGRIRTGVLEQSWRAGGASMAEVSALQTFKANPALKVVRAFTRERYGEHQPCPPADQLVYRGPDPDTGFITKYGGVSSHGDT